MSTPQQPATGAGTSKLRQAMGAAAPDARTPYERFRNQINMVRRDVAAMVGDDKVDKFIRVCLNAVQHNPDTLDADRRSLLLACLEAAQDGLLPDGSEAVFNVYKTKVKKNGREEWVPMVQYLPMAYGLVQKIYEAGATYVDAVAVYEKDDFEYERGDNPRIVHKPFGGDASPGKVVAAYVVVKFPKLETKREVMFRRDVELVRSKSKAADGMMWKDFYDQGAIKSVIHRINKQLPQSERLQRALAHDNKAVGLSAVETVDDSGSNLEAIIEGRLPMLPEHAGGQPVPGATQVQGQRQPVTVDQPKAEQQQAAAQAQQAAEGGTTTGMPGPKGGSSDAPTVTEGTPEKRDELVGKLKAAANQEALDVAVLEVDFFTWTKPDRQVISSAYEERRTELAG
jgi:recombination protein RecT